ncbi:MAG: hypothetical protein JWM34_5028 [Ilumatobacteraceae bacterium]|nr:hypothetical protein [Ilumatobacteraceae bacterium]
MPSRSGGRPRTARRLALITGLALITTAITTATAGGPALAADVITSIRAPGATATALAVRVTPPTITSAHFTTVPPGATLPTDAQCAAAVRPMAERRTENTTANHTPGIGTTTGYPRVTGDFTGTTDEIIEWVACKWGIDEDIVRAQIAKESWWRQDTGGDLTSDQSICDPAVRTSSGPCPESVGLGQVRYQYHGEAFADENAVRSSAYNLDYTYAVWRSCYEGDLTWLNTVERGSPYAAGDQWGCLGVWFSGRWHTSAADGYIAAVQGYLAQRIWETPDFQGG